jgi:hypothetical protein
MKRLFHETGRQRTDSGPKSLLKGIRRGIMSADRNDEAVYSSGIEISSQIKNRKKPIFQKKAAKLVSAGICLVRRGFPAFGVGLPTPPRT